MFMEYQQKPTYMPHRSFSLHPQLETDTLPVGELPLCRVLLMNQRHFPWIILVPKRENMRELFDLAAADYALAMEETRRMSLLLADITRADKINVAALGNIVPQLHIHIIARFKNDAAWPNPVWNCGVKTEPYDTHPQWLEMLRRNITKM